MSVPQSPLISSINRETFHSALSRRPQEDEMEDFQSYMPQDIEFDPDKQRIFAEECMKKAGGFGRFQWIICACLLLGVTSSSLITQCIYMLEHAPHYQCKTINSETNETEWQSCTSDTFCTDGKPNGVEYQIDYSFSDSLDNWYVFLNLQCNTRYSTISLFQISFFIGVIFGCIIFSKGADIAGRKPIFYLGILMHIILVSTMFIVTEMQWFLAIVFLIGMEDVARFLVGYIYFSEFCLERNRPIVSSIAFFLATISACFCAIYFYTISRNWMWLHLIGLVCSVISLASFPFAPESPRWLIANQQYNKLFAVYKKVAHYNGVTFSDLIFRLKRRSASITSEIDNQISDPNNWVGANMAINSGRDSNEIDKNDESLEVTISKPKTRPLLKDVCRNKNLRTKFLILLFCWCSYMYCYYALESFLKYVLEDIYTDTILTSVSEAVAFPVSGFLYRRYGGKPLVVCGFVAAAAFSLITIGFKDNSIALAIFVIGIKANISLVINSLYLITFDTFSTVYVCSVFGIMQFTSRVVGISAPYTNEFAYPLPALIVAILTLSAAILAGLFFKERSRTNNK